MDAMSAAALASAFAKLMGLANQGKVADVQGDLIELQRNVMEVVAENESAHRENGELKRRLETRESARRENGIVYFGADPTPFCGTCFGKNQGYQIPLIDTGFYYLECGNCETKPPKPNWGRPEENGGGDPIQPGDEILKGGGR